MNQQTQHTVIRMATVLLLLSTAMSTQAQTAAFTYQGRLGDGGTAANGTYDLQFALFDSLTSGNQIGSQQTVSSVSVSGGIFSVSLDFGAGAFPGANRWLEIRARLSGAATFTTLAPRQPITSTPYAVRSLVSSSADAVPVSGVPVGSGNYIQNNPASQQAGNFNISGNGTTGGMLSGVTVNATTQYNIAGTRTIFSSSGNMFVGNAAGESNTSGDNNSFFGTLAGSENSTGSGNSYFGGSAGLSSQGSNNTFVGGGVAFAQNVGSNNSFFGANAGVGNIEGSRNTLLGTESEVGLGDLTNATAVGANARVDQSNSLVLGSVATVNGATSSVNVGINITRPQATLDVRGTTLVSGNLGIGIGPTNTPMAKLHVVGSSWFQGDNTPLPPSAGKGIVMGFSGEQGYIAAFDYGGAFAPKNLLLNNPGGNVGIGTTSPTATLDVNGAGVFRPAGVASPRATSFGSPSGETGMTINGPSNRADVRFDGTTLKLLAGVGTGPPASTSGVVISTVGSVGIGTTTPFLNTKLDIVGGFLRLDSLAGGGDESVCRNSAAHTLAFCSSSLRYKERITPYTSGLQLINRLRPISFSWKDSGRPDLGLGAEEVAAVEPLLVTINNEGVVEGVKYDRLNLILINAIKEQQQQIARQQELISQLQQQQKLILAQQKQQAASLNRVACLGRRRWVLVNRKQK